MRTSRFFALILATCTSLFSVSQIAIVLVCIAAAIATTYSYGQAHQQQSLRHGIAQTQQSLAQVSELLDENQADIVNLMTRVKVDLAEYTPLDDMIGLFKIGSNGFEGAKAFHNQDYLQAMGQTAEAVAAVWGKSEPWLELGTKVIDAVADVLELRSLMNEQQQLMLAQTALQQELLRLQGKDPEALAQWQQILSNLYGDPAVEHAAFLKLLAAHGLSQKDVEAKALANAAAVSPGTASRAASGMSIILERNVQPKKATAISDPCNDSYQRGMIVQAKIQKCVDTSNACFAHCAPLINTSVKALGDCNYACLHANEACLQTTNSCP
jgi:hypothetical protein